MIDPQTEIGGTPHRFPSTVQSVVKGRDRHSLERLVALYWKPVYGLIRRSGSRTNEDAKDLTQEFFVREILEGPLLGRFDPARGSFRAFLRSAVVLFLRRVGRDAAAQKRGGDAVVLALGQEGFDLSELVQDAQAMTPEEVFDAAWRETVLQRAVVLLREKLRGDGKEVTFEIFRRYDLEPDGPQVSYKTLGDAFGLSADTVKNQLTHARREFRRVVTGLLAETSGTPRELSQELDTLFGE